MVRKIGKKSISAIIVIALLTVLAVQTFAESPYKGSFGSTYLTFFEDIPVSALDDYVVYRSENNAYVMVVGDLIFENNSFYSSEPCSKYVIQQVSSSSSGSYQSYYSYYVIEISSFNLTCSDILVYSNLGDYPALSSKSDNYTFALLIIFSILFLCILLYRVFKFNLRYKYL